MKLATMKTPDAIDVDPTTGDIYILAFDSGSPTMTATTGFGPDTDGDFDLLKIPFSTVFGTWESTFKGNDARSIINTAPAAFNPAPTAGYAVSNNLDYVSFHAGTTSLTEGDLTPEIEVPSDNANRYYLDNAIVKIGEVKRNEVAGDFFSRSFEFIDEDTMFILDNRSTAFEAPSTDHNYRIVERISTDPKRGG